MLESGILASNLYYAMYAHTDEDVDIYLEKTEMAFKLVAGCDNLAQALRGEPSRAGFKRLA